MKKNKKEKKEEIVENKVEEIDEVLLEMLENYHPDSFPLANGTYRLVEDYRDGFDYETLIKRYNVILEKYDYIVGDWGYDQLRLKGFFKDDFKGAPIDAKISILEDYLYEYCNFGCAYFVIEQIGEFKRKGRSSQPKKPRNKKTAHIDERKNGKKTTGKGNKYSSKPSNKPKSASSNSQKKVKNKEVKSPLKKKNNSTERHFTIKKKEN